MGGSDAPLFQAVSAAKTRTSQNVLRTLQPGSAAQVATISTDDSAMTQRVDREQASSATRHLRTFEGNATTDAGGAPLTAVSAPISRRTLLRAMGVLGGAAIAGLPMSAAQAAGRPLTGPRRSKFRPMLWTDSRSWAAGQVPGPGEVAVVDRPIIAVGTAHVAGIEITPTGALIFAPMLPVHLTSTGNVVVRGRLQMRPQHPAVEHRITFAGIDESAFVGGGMEVAATDVGLWVMGSGVLDAAGSHRLPWTRLTAGVAAGTSSLDLPQDPTGWRPGDELVIAPTLPPDVEGFVDAYDTVRIAAVEGQRVHLDQPLRFDHPSVSPGQGLTLGAEILNLTRNVVVGGTATGRAHILLRPAGAQQISDVRIEHVGPAKQQGIIDGDGEPVRTPVLGRYALHFHHAGSATRGSVVDSVVVTAAGNHAFVPHMSHGIEFRGCIAHDSQLAQYWWDIGDESNDIVYDRCIGSRMQSIAARGILRDAAGEQVAGLFQNRIGPFELQRGANNRIRQCTAFGTVGGGESAAFHWNSDTSGLWAFDTCLAHNNRAHGSFVWLNNDQNHKVHGMIAYHNGGSGIVHGAYLNNFTYTRAVCYRNAAPALRHHANTRHHPHQQTWIDCIFDAAGADYAMFADKHNVGVADDVDPRSVRFVRCDFRGARQAAIGRRQGTSNFEIDYYDFEDCSYQGTEFHLGTTHLATRWRVQDQARGAIVLMRADQGRHYEARWDAAVQPAELFATPVPGTQPLQVHVP